ncbi:demethylmacrocin O-methyltransferase [Saccharopolyspora phatthalungensis]|uniref:Demethylmacrocin O-methyltransferase n=1 Tax=Saccharopolyspora phatthalungensis TaxID=664693 RepID=A0A840QJV9_9PSEU|nr:demethylmacrocin O-methyltransferase [Saccharopolyspora phatthalungensis]
MKVKPWGPVEPLLRSAACGEHELASTIERIGLEQTTDVVVAEMEMRCEPPRLSSSVPFRFEVLFKDARSTRDLTIGSNGLAVAHHHEAPVAVVRFDAIDLLESLFGPSGRRPHVSREVEWDYDRALTSSTDWDVNFRRWHEMTTAMECLVAACSVVADDLGRLSARCGSDKWANLHWYTQHYEHHFARLRDEPVRMLEIGIGGYQLTDQGGASLSMWQRYFRRGLVYGLDIFDKPGVRGSRIRAVQGDQSDPEFLDDLGRELGPFDIIIDDGSHVNDHVKTSFAALFPHVRSGGLYVIEDLQTAYWPGFGGNDRDRTASDTSMGMLKTLVDGLNHKEMPMRARNGQSYTDRHIVGVHFYHNLAVIDKGLNAEAPIPACISEVFSEEKQYTGGAVNFGSLASASTPDGSAAQPVGED